MFPVWFIDDEPPKSSNNSLIFVVQLHRIFTEHSFSTSSSISSLSFNLLWSRWCLRWKFPLIIKPFCRYYAGQWLGSHCPGTLSQSLSRSHVSSWACSSMEIWYWPIQMKSFWDPCFGSPLFWSSRGFSSPSWNSMQKPTVSKESIVKKLEENIVTWFQFS